MFKTKYTIMIKGKVWRLVDENGEVVRDIEELEKKLLRVILK